MIKYVCFDLDGVLFAPTCFKYFKAKVSELTKKPEIIDEVFHGDKMDDFKRGIISELVFWAYADTELGLNLGINGYYGLLKNCYVLQPEILAFVQELKSKGKRISICTNNFPTRIRAAHDATGFLDLIDTAILSYEVGSLKPDKLIYQALIDRSGCEPSEIFYSDDNEDKLKGAIDLGIQCVATTSISSLIEQIKDRI